MWIEEYRYDNYETMMAEEEPIEIEEFKINVKNEEELISYYKKYDYELVDRFFNDTEYCFEYVGNNDDIKYVCARLEQSF